MNLSVVILAAGCGRRMKSLKPKVLHKVLGKPMLQYAIDAVKPLRPQNLVVIVGNGAEAVRKKITDGKISFVLQKQLLGTGNALTAAKRALKGFKEGTVLVLNGDCPLITTKTLKGLLKKHREKKNALSFLSFINNSLSGYGRIMRDERGRVISIVEDKHVTYRERKKIKELNGGIYIMETETLDYLKRIRKNASSGEYYLTDIVDIIFRAGGKLDAYSCDPDEILGVNSREDLYEVSRIFNRRNISKWMSRGVTFMDPRTSIVHSTVTIGKDTVVYPNTIFEGRTSIGKNCRIYPGTRINHGVLGDNVIIKDSTIIEESRIRGGAAIGPFAHLRPDSDIGCDVKIGNFVEIKKARIGDRTKASHLTYLGDSEIGNDVNIGAGTITCNYDGQSKHKTVIESGVFVGSGTQIVAPVKIGRGAYVAAGSTITGDVPEGALAVTRINQKNLKGWAKKKRRKNSS